MAEELRAVTLADLAREAGTSASTASRALSGLGYVPNASARTLKQRTSRVVGVVVSDLGNQFYAWLALGIEQTLREAGYQMAIIGDNSESSAEIEAARTFVAMHVAGVIMTPVGPAPAAVLARHGVHVADGEDRIGALLESGRPTAVFAGNNTLAESAWRVLRQRGLRLPDDVSLVAFDDVPWMRMVDPQITAVAQPTVEMGRRAAALLLRRASNPAAPPRVERLQPALVLRGSTFLAP